MDPTDEIKARLPIEELVSSYCQLKKKGRGFVALCPFHNDTHPSFQISPDKGIAYCFACQKGGDIFSFYQAIEGVDFRQALQDLAQRAGVTLKERAVPAAQKDEKERLRACLDAACRYYRDCLKRDERAAAYVRERRVPAEILGEFRIGYAPDSFSDTYQHLLKEGFSQSDIVAAGLAIRKELQEGKMYDRFRDRLMFPIADHQGNPVGFGGRTLGTDDAKYINSPEGPLYSKSQILFGLHCAREEVRRSRTVILVEGYFDVIACHRVGVRNVVAASGTALTEQHVKMLKRGADLVVLCLDQDRAGQEASERSFRLCSAQGLPVHAIILPFKDPDEAANADPDALRTLLQGGGVPYLDTVVAALAAGDYTQADQKRAAVLRLLPLIKVLPLATEQEHYIGKVAELLHTTEEALKEDIARMPGEPASASPVTANAPAVAQRKGSPFGPLEITLGLFVLHPGLLYLLQEIIPPDGGFAGALFTALRARADAGAVAGAAGGDLPGSLELPDAERERLQILLLFCEHHGFADWSQSLAVREIRRNAAHANRECLKRKQEEIVLRLQEARRSGRKAEEAQLSTQYQHVLKLAKMAG